MVRHWCMVRGLALAVLAATIPSVALADCTSLLQRFNVALKARDLGEVMRVEQRIFADPSCVNRVVDVQRQRTMLQLIQAQQLIRDGAPAAQYEPLLAEAEKPEVLWQASETVGELRFHQKRFVEATVALERALDIINDARRTPRRPEPARIQAIFDRAANARLIAAAGVGKDKRAQVVPAPLDHRDGSIGGIFSRSFRGFTPTVVPIPIMFVTATTRFTPEGEEAAKHLLTALQQQKPPVITLVGHADERGDPYFNQQLSADRAAAVAAYLQQGGINGRFATSGKGSSQPVPRDRLDGLSQEELWAVDRRVEWQRPPEH